MRSRGYILAMFLLTPVLQSCQCNANDDPAVHLYLSDTEEKLYAKLQETVASSEARFVQSIMFDHIQLTDRVASMLPKLSGLQVLEIGGGGGSAETFVEKGAYQHLAECSSLRSLKLIEYVEQPYLDGVETPITFVEKMSALDNLELDLPVNEEGMASIARISKLKSILFRKESTDTSGQAWYNLVHKESSQELVMDGFQEDLSIKNVFKDPSNISIKQLSLLDTYQRRKWSSEDVDAIAAIKCLESLQVGTIEASDIALLSPLKCLKELDVRAKGSVSQLGVVRSSQSLQKLTLVCDSFDAHKDLVGHPSLSEVEINGRQWIRSETGEFNVAEE
ncbi:MAG: hypothetical protein R3C01_09725 [Planctomycetaceae bacterium]